MCWASLAETCLKSRFCFAIGFLEGIEQGNDGDERADEE